MQNLESIIIIMIVRIVSDVAIFKFLNIHLENMRSKWRQYAVFSDNCDHIKFYKYNHLYKKVLKVLNKK